MQIAAEAYESGAVAPAEPVEGEVRRTPRRSDRGAPVGSAATSPRTRPERSRSCNAAKSNRPARHTTSSPFIYGFRLLRRADFGVCVIDMSTTSVGAPGQVVSGPIPHFDTVSTFTPLRRSPVA